MWMPSHAGFARIFAAPPPQGHYFSQRLHPNPAFYKYTWRVWTPECEWEGHAFFECVPVLSTARFMAMRDSLKAAGVHHFVYNTARPRLGATPFDRSHPRWAGVRFAPALEDDMDPPWNGHR
ncbi:hypothetical protein [Cupriavidus basilensis]|uniref:Uncharacterized protein n=1 Tax=Cupriavidus basilensis TaxID=68895 RepID=A0A643FXA5_9BURK|nr:hypothetical protein [Cupriavidus basilensis]QOT76573.1 hypothetical protein F7R26_000185 [Cupriavidus basilensis]